MVGTSSGGHDVRFAGITPIHVHCRLSASSAEYRLPLVVCCPVALYIVPPGSDSDATRPVLSKQGACHLQCSKSRARHVVRTGSLNDLHVTFSCPLQCRTCGPVARWRLR